MQYVTVLGICFQLVLLVWLMFSRHSNLFYVEGWWEPDVKRFTADIIMQAVRWNGFSKFCSITLSCRAGVIVLLDQQFDVVSTGHIIPTMVSGTLVHCSGFSPQQCSLTSCVARRSFQYAIVGIRSLVQLLERMLIWSRLASPWPCYGSSTTLALRRLACTSLSGSVPSMYSHLWWN